MLGVVQEAMRDRSGAPMRILGGRRCWIRQNRKTERKLFPPPGQAIRGQESGPSSKKRECTISMLKGREVTVSRGRAPALRAAQKSDKA